MDQRAARKRAEQELAATEARARRQVIDDLSSAASATLAALDDLDDQVARNKARYDAYRRLLPTLPGLRLLAFEEGGPTSYKTIVVELTKPHQTSPCPCALPTMTCAYQTGKIVATTMADTEELAKS